MEKYRIERQGGLAGLKARGTVEASSLEKSDLDVMKELFKQGADLKADKGADRFVYKVTRESGGKAVSREIPETLLPRALARAVKEEI